MIDACACPKDKGMYGEGGWHLARLDADAAFHVVRRRELTDFKRRNSREPKAEEIDQINRDSTEMSARYVGTVMAVERCPAYEAKRLLGRP